jgi:uncharacterized protein (DUF427 family)
MTASLRFEPAPFRVRAFKGGKTLVDTRRARIAYGDKPPNFWVFPKEDVHGATVTFEHDGYVAVSWAEADEWWEEDERVFGGHPRSPHHRVDARISSRHVVVSWKGTVIADSHRAVLVAETDLPLRYYLPRADARFELLRRADTTTWCAYKGLCNYYDLVTSDGVRPGAIWTYEHPLVDAPPAIAGLLGIWHEKLEVTVDGHKA